ncbi:PEROXIDASE [Salix viminalis]|uniref:peroxidase n=1 Tax=Salix viminalis TaxID=40686 RepID=A0A9Q0NUR5_SALVM|nr:PEROXIDASE [Salix viminalis]
MKVEAAFLTLALGFISVNFAGFCYGALQVGFYRGKCGFADVEAIVAGVITAQFFRDPSTVAALLPKNVSLPGPAISVPEAIAAFSDKGLTVTDMVLLLGAHSVGFAHCSFIRDRLFNFENTGRPDPSMDPFLANILGSRCTPFATVDNTVNLDQNSFSPFTISNTYYQNVILHRGILQIDQDIGTDPLTKPVVTNLASAFDFPARFGSAMVKMGAIGVLTGTQGEIRRSCRATNR